MNDNTTGYIDRLTLFYSIPFSSKRQEGESVFFRRINRLSSFSQKQRDIFRKVWYTMPVRKGTLPRPCPYERS